MNNDLLIHASHSSSVCVHASTMVGVDCVPISHDVVPTWTVASARIGVTKISSADDKSISTSGPILASVYVYVYTTG